MCKQIIEKMSAAAVFAAAKKVSKNGDIFLITPYSYLKL